jgi:predicted transposase/invertase (TIGR01784 family)
MFDIDLAWEKLLVETGDAARWEARGEEKGREEGHAEGMAKAALNLKALGVSTEIIVKSTGLSPEEIAKL